MLLSSKKLIELRRELYFIKKNSTKKTLTQDELGSLAIRVNEINEYLLAYWLKLKQETNKFLNIKEH